MKANILILDDDHNIRNFLGRLFKKKGFTFSEAASAEEARELLKRQSFELALCDINLPGESGLEFARFALSEYPGRMIPSPRKPPLISVSMITSLNLLNRKESFSAWSMP